MSDNYKFKLDFHLQEFEKAIKENNKELARIYIDLIYGASTIGIKYPYISLLFKELDKISEQKSIAEGPGKQKIIK